MTSVSPHTHRNREAGAPGSPVFTLLSCVSGLKEQIREEMWISGSSSRSYEPVYNSLEEDLSDLSLIWEINMLFVSAHPYER